MTGAAGGLAGGLWARFGAELRAGRGVRARGARLRRAHARGARASSSARAGSTRTTLEGKVAGELATSARQAGVPCHAIVGQAALELFGRRMLDLQTVLEAATVEALEAAGEALAGTL